MDNTPPPGELGLTSKDMGVQHRPDATAIAQAHQKILRFDTPEYFVGYDEIKGQKSPTVTKFQTSDGEQTIDLVGTQHAHQLPNQEARKGMMARFDEQIREYLDATASDPSKRLLMVEGGNISGVTTIQQRTERMGEVIRDLFQKNDIRTKEDAVDKFGEMGAVMWTSIKEGVPIMSPEPSVEETLAKQKEAGIPEVDIALKQAILQLDVYVHRGELKGDKRFTQAEVFNALRTACEQTGWQKDMVEQVRTRLSGNAQADAIVIKSFIDYVLPQLNQRMKVNHVGFNLVNPDYSWAFDPTDREVYNHLHSPASKVEVFNKMSNATGEFRDDYILDRIVEAVADGKSPFIAYGDGHTVKLKPAISHLYEEVESSQSHNLT